MTKYYFIFFALLASFELFAQSSNCIIGDCKDGYGELRNKKGDFYKGYFQQGLYEGKGVLVYANGDVYSGNFMSGQRQGLGLIEFADGSQILAHWENDAFSRPVHKTLGCTSGDCWSGQGTYLWADGSKYIGQFKGSLRHGTGTLVTLNGDRFHGTWELDSLNGFGVYNGSDGSKYEGLWKGNVRHGQGKLFVNGELQHEGYWLDGEYQGAINAPDVSICLSGDCQHGNGTLKYGMESITPGSKYTGQWLNGLRDGYGVFTQIDSTKIAGFWQNNEFVATDTAKTTCQYGNCVDGYGIYVWHTGEQYQGFWHDDKRNGWGYNLFDSGNEYMGLWKDNLKQGYGIHKFNNGEVYEGLFKDDYRHGYGKFIFANGNYFEGVFRNDDISGEGTLYLSNGRLIRGLWKNNERIAVGSDLYGCVSGNCENGFGTYVYSTGTRYTGEWSDSRYSGHGILLTGDGEFYVGNFKMGHKSGFGRYKNSIGERYIGDWQNDKYNGRGVFVYPNDSTIRAIWREGSFLVESPTNPDVPKIVWFAPEPVKLPAYNNNYQLRFAVNSSTKLTDIEVFINHKRQAASVHLRSQSDRIEPGFEYFIEHKITLEPGVNLIRIKAKNQYGETTSSHKEIEYFTNYQAQRIALVVAIDDYADHQQKDALKNAEDMKKALQKRGFEVLFAQNPDQDSLQRALRHFGQKLQKNRRVGLFYFAGGGMQVEGQNYMIPAQSELQIESELKYLGVNFHNVLNEMQQAGCDTNIVLLDVSHVKTVNTPYRINPKMGLIDISARENTFIGYSCAPGSVLSADANTNQFTKKLVKSIVANTDLHELFKELKQDISKKTDNVQIPWYESTLPASFKF